MVRYDLVKDRQVEGRRSTPGYTHLTYYSVLRVSGSTLSRCPVETHYTPVVQGHPYEVRDRKEIDFRDGEYAPTPFLPDPR